jgi:hypothetical protein
MVEKQRVEVGFSGGKTRKTKDYQEVTKRLS